MTPPLWNRTKTKYKEMMALYPYKCQTCGLTAELNASMGSAPLSMPCPHCGDTLKQDYHAKSVQFMQQEKEKEENKLTEADRPTPQALRALYEYIAPTGEHRTTTIPSTFQFGKESNL